MKKVFYIDRLSFRSCNMQYSRENFTFRAYAARKYFFFVNEYGNISWKHVSPYAFQMRREAQHAAQLPS